MSYKATMEFGLHLHEFNNVDLFQQGLYYLRMSLHHVDSKGRKIFAQPYNLVQCQENPQIAVKQEKKSKGFVRQFGDGQIEDETFSFCTQKFPIRFCEETVPLNLMCFWRSEVDAYPQYQNNQFILTCELMCADFSMMGQCQNNQENAFKQVSLFECQVNNSSFGIHEYIPIQFSGHHYCQAEATFHTVLLDFKFRLSDYQLELMSNNPNNKTVVNNKENAIGNSLLIQPSSFLEFLNKITYRFKQEYVQQFFEYYVVGLRQSYQNLKKVLVQVLEAFPELKRVSATLHEPVLELPYPDLPSQNKIFSQPKGITPILSQKQGFQQAQNSQYPFSQNSTNIFSNQSISQSGFSQQLSSQHQRQPIYQQQHPQIQQNYQNNNAITQALGISSYNYKNQSRSIQQQFSLDKEIPQIAKFYNLNDFKQMDLFSKFVLSDMNIVSGNIFQLWNKLIELLRIDGDRSINYLKKPYILRMKEKWGESVSRDQFPHDITQPKEKKTGKQNEVTSNILRQKLELMIEHHSESLNLVDLNLIPQTDLRPFLLEEIYINQFKKIIPSQNYNKKSHVIVLCHGFQGNYFDMRLVKNNLYLMYPDALFLSSKSNEEFTNGNLADMGKRLSIEVIQYIKEWCPGDTLGRLSFIGHSLGGVIIRAALPHLSEYSDKMFLYMSLSSPHLGYMYNSSKLIEAGIWFLKTTRKSECLTQLHMSDSEQLADCYLYKLTNQPGLNWFRNIALLSSYQDQYVPFESARIQKCDEASNENQKGRIYNSMVDNLIGQLRTDRIHRIDVNFKIKDNKTIKKTIDNMIGRSAHIQFLESDALAKTLVYCFDHLFQ
ncbi:hypothetical protein ABPG72_021258 [Tetrahymena utriculariae]